MTKNTNKMPLFERTVDKIVTDNSAVIAALNVRIAKLELTCAGRANSINEMSNIIAELQKANAELEKELKPHRRADARELALDSLLGIKD
tara:strand:+ start:14 stop:283 length:270 start_codon:yes stop_codon:yes gene_type:complete